MASAPDSGKSGQGRGKPPVAIGQEQAIAIAKRAIAMDHGWVDRLTFSIETQRVLSQKLHSIFFLRYNYEDVRLRNIESLVIQPILQPDQVVRLSGLGASFVVDTRERCERRLPGSVAGDDETLRSGEVCRYNQTDATRGQFLSADFRMAARALGGNTSLMRFQSTYHTYYKVQQARNTVFAGNLTMGLASLSNPRDLNGLLASVSFPAVQPPCAGSAMKKQARGR